MKPKIFWNRMNEWLMAYLTCLLIVNVALAVDGILVLRGERTITFYAREKWVVTLAVMLPHMFCNAFIVMHLLYD